VGNVVAAALVVLLFAGVVAACVRIAVRTWTDAGRFDETASFFRRRASTAVANGLARGIAVFAAQWICAACAVILVMIGMASRSGAWMVTAAFLFAGFFATFPLLFMICLFNRPRPLVVPYMRDLDRAAIRAASRTS
jgi:hypothetical protein